MRAPSAVAVGVCTGVSAVLIESDQARKTRLRSGKPSSMVSPQALLAFDGATAVGWCQVTPRDAVPWLDRLWQLKRVDDAPVWSLSCLYVRKKYRRHGITSHLIAAALEAARRANAPALEAYPFDADVSPSASGSGYASTFARAGFRVVARRVPARPIMRYDFTAKC